MLNPKASHRQISVVRTEIIILHQGYINSNNLSVVNSCGSVSPRGNLVRLRLADGSEMQPTRGVSGLFPSSPDKERLLLTSVTIQPPEKHDFFLLILSRAKFLKPNIAKAYIRTTKASFPAVLPPSDLFRTVRFFNSLSPSEKLDI